MSVLFTGLGGDGHNIGVFMPVAGTIPESPISCPLNTPQTIQPPDGARLLIIYADDPIHIRVSRTGVAATTDDMPAPGGAWIAMPWRDGDHLSFRAKSIVAGTEVWIECARELNQAL